MTFKDTDKILVNRGGVDYQADIEPLLKKPIIERWTAPTGYSDLTTETAPFAVGDSSCRGSYYRKWSVKGSPHDLKLEDGSFGYIMPVVCGGGNQWGEQGSLIIVNKKLEEQKIIDLPNANGLMNGGHIMAFPYLDKHILDYGQPALEFHNILVWSDSTGIWGSFDYGDSWTQFKGYNGDSWIPTDLNCRLAFNSESGSVKRAYIRFDGDQTSFTGITDKMLRVNLQQLGDAPRGNGMGLEGLLHTDLLDMPDPEGIWDWTTEKEATVTFPENHEVMSWHYESESYFRTEEDKISNSSGLKHFKIIHAHSTGAKWNKGDSLDDIFDIYVTEFGPSEQMGNWKADFHKRWIRSIPNHDMKDGAYFLPKGFLLNWDAETHGYFSRYDDPYRWANDQEDNRNLETQLLWTSQTLQDTVVAYHAGAPFLDGEAPDTRNGESGVQDSNKYGCWITRLGTTALMRFGDHWEWRIVDAPTKGQEDGWSMGVLRPDDEVGEDSNWLISLPDKRLWSGTVVTTTPVYSLKDGFLIEGEFIEAAYPETAQMFHPTL